MTNYDNFDNNYLDETLAVQAKNGDKPAMENLIDKYAWLARSAARVFYMPGADKEDLVQEGMIGLYRAIMGFNEGRSVKFYYFAKLCVERQIQSAVKSALRGKHSPLKDYSELPEAETLPDDSISAQPIDILISREDKASVEELMAKSLSLFESKALYLFIQGYTYIEIAERMDTTRKSVDNALGRVRKKLRKA